jgi:hypothetical protein
MAHSAVRFIAGGSGILSLLEIESEHCADPFPAISGLLFELRVQIVRVETQTDELRVLSRLQLVEFDGGRIDSARRRGDPEQRSCGDRTASRPAPSTTGDRFASIADRRSGHLSARAKHRHHGFREPSPNRDGRSGSSCEPRPNLGARSLQEKRCAHAWLRAGSVLRS